MTHNPNAEWRGQRCTCPVCVKPEDFAEKVKRNKAHLAVVAELQRRGLIGVIPDRPVRA